LLKGHEKSITTVKYNADGDLIFTTSKDQNPTVWYSETGERLGTYGHYNDGVTAKNYHRGAIWDIDCSWDSQYVITACADGKARMFETVTGKYIARFAHPGPVRSCVWSEGKKLFATASDPFHSRDLGNISIFTFPDPNEPHDFGQDEPGVPTYIAQLTTSVDDYDKAICLGWTMGNKYLIAGFESGNVIKYDASNGREVCRVKVHQDRVNRLSFNRDKTLMITCSKDCTAKLINPENLETLKTYRTETPVNGAVISPTHPHVIIGGGQDAQSVTTTRAGSGKFETRFFHMIYEEEFGRVKGHFGPINSLAVHPYGKSFASGAEDGYIRVHPFEQSYLSAPDEIPHRLKTKEGLKW
jgi:translation initiation factor 3 subunit I